MNDFDEKYEIRRAKVSDIDSIMEYIEDDWRSGHIMARNRQMFEYEFLDADGLVNVVIAIDRVTRRIEGMIGYLYSSIDSSKRDVWGSIWKVRDGSKSLLGAEIMKRMEETSGCRYNLGTGANPQTNIPLMRVMFRRLANKMKHYYRLADMDVNDFMIAKVVNIKKTINSTTKDGDLRSYSITQIQSANELHSLFDTKICMDAIPYKDLWYIDKKFFNHPIHQYMVYGIGENDKYVAAFVLRKQMANGHFCIRMVDFIGDLAAIKYTNDFWDELLRKEEAEYVDFYCLGIQDEDMFEAGFSLLDDSDENVIPNYFSPFVQENIDIWVHYPVEGVVFTKADGDQDRPN